MDRRSFLRGAAAVIFLPSVRKHFIERAPAVTAVDGLSVKVYLDGKLVAAGTNERVMGFPLPDDGQWHHLVAVTEDGARGAWFKGKCRDARDLFARSFPSQAQVSGHMHSTFDSRSPLSSLEVAGLYAPGLI